MVDSRDKGQRAEYAVRDILRKATGLKWERVPGSGGFNATHGLKGDIYLPDKNSKYCIEIKHYKDDVINSNLLNSTVSTLEKFWLQTVRESEELDKEPLLIFKKDRGQWLLASRTSSASTKEIIFYSDNIEDTFYVYKLEEWLDGKTADHFLKGEE